MKTLTSLGLAMFGAGVFVTALVALGIVCVLGVGMAAAACDFQPVNDVAMTSGVARRFEGVGPEDGESPALCYPSAEDFAYALDFDSPTTDSLPPGSVPVL